MPIRSRSGASRLRAVALMLPVLIPAAASAQPGHWGHGGGWHGGGRHGGGWHRDDHRGGRGAAIGAGIAGLAVGALVGGALASRAAPPPPPPVYYQAPPPPPPPAAYAPYGYGNGYGY